MKTFSALLVFCEGKPPDSGVFPSQKPGTRSFDVFFDKKRLNKQSEQRWNNGGSLWRHSNVLIEKYISVFVFALGTFFPTSSLQEYVTNLYDQRYWYCR